VAVIEDTGGLIKPFNLTSPNSESAFSIASISYIVPTETKTTESCPYMEVWLYDTKNQIVDFTIISPGQSQSPCISLDGRQSVTAYSGVTLTSNPPSDLLDWINKGSP
jgi:hypothetical protein